MSLRLCQKPIFIALSPNTEKDDVFLALKLLFQPWKWRCPTFPTAVGKVGQMLEKEFQKYLDTKYAFVFNSGRSAFLAILASLDLEQGSEVLLQAFTCNALVNPILWSGLKPVFVDIEKETLNMDPRDLERKITKKSRGVVIQHTFGLPAFAKASAGLPAFAKASAGKPAEMDKILEICQKHNLVLIEDCAHSLGASYQGKKVGTFGKASFFSFGRDKIISSVWGGMAVTNDQNLAQKIKRFQEKCSFPSYFWIFQQLLHPLLIHIFVIPLFNFFKIGKGFLFCFQKIGLLTRASSQREKQGQKPDCFPQKMPQALAILAHHQFQKLARFLSHQKKIARFYDKSLKDKNILLPLKTKARVYLRYPILVKKGQTSPILKRLAKESIFLDDGWRKTVIVPPDTDQSKMGYFQGSCPRAEKVAKAILNLPTHINISQEKAKRIIIILIPYL